ncbi:unnamed protein product [Hermetia illucens]|uniref:DUF7775 domain-containing protein n=1 Tax=Hermetia illucens TaxID=343691 RepID=A0A7R8YXY4_HERIL|nr:uncharacterized protein LOC119657486 [Hermetia illucens]CAD7089918.1 unnamed protein product [Hermetia illucens]
MIDDEVPRARLSVVKFMELVFAITCLVLHYYSFYDGDIVTSFITTGTFTGFVVIIVALFGGLLMHSPINKRIDILLSIMGCASFITSGVLLIEAWEYSFRTKTRDLAIIKASVAIINGAMFGFDAIFTFRDK